jgi:YVTN family beta-propeller protein
LGINSVNPKTDMIYVANRHDNTISVIDGQNNTLVKTVPVGKGPFNVATNPATNMIYVTNHSTHTISIINGTSGVVSTLMVKEKPSGVDMNYETNTLYVNEQGANDTIAIQNPR